MLIWKPSLPKYNFRMAQVMQWPPAIRNYMRKVRLKYQHVPPPNTFIFKQRKKPGSDCIYRLGTRVTVYACVLKFFLYSNLLSVIEKWLLHVDISTLPSSYNYE